MMRVLVPLDGSLLAEQALPTAVSIARKRGATLHLLLVNEGRPGVGLEGWPWAISTARTHGDYIREKAKHLGAEANIAVDHTIAEGRVADEICRHAREQQAALIIIATRAHTGVARILGGSVADAVVRHAHVPVLLLPAAPPGRHIRPRSHRIDRILIALDGSDESTAALEAAIGLADPGVTELDVVEVVPPVSLPPFDVVRRVTRIDRAATQEAVDKASGQLADLAARVAERSGCDVYSHVVAADDVARGILRIAHGFNASIVAMGTRGRGASRLFMGSVAERIIRDGRYPMLMVGSPHAGVAVSDDEHFVPDSIFDWTHV